MIRQYFLNYTRVSSDFTIDLATGDIVWLTCRRRAVAGDRAGHGT